MSDVQRRELAALEARCEAATELADVLMALRGKAIAEHDVGCDEQMSGREWRDLILRLTGGTDASLGECNGFDGWLSDIMDRIDERTGAS